MAPSSDPAVQCQQQPPATEEVLVREVTNGEQPPVAYTLGGGWVWDFGAEECITSTELAVRSHAPLAGFCTQVAPVSANPGYDPNQVPAPPLNGLTASVGDC